MTKFDYKMFIIVGSIGVVVLSEVAYIFSFVIIGPFVMPMIDLFIPILLIGFSGIILLIIESK